MYCASTQCTDHASQMKVASLQGTAVLVPWLHRTRQQYLIEDRARLVDRDIGHLSPMLLSKGPKVKIDHDGIQRLLAFIPLLLSQRKHLPADQLEQGQRLVARGERNRTDVPRRSKWKLLVSPPPVGLREEGVDLHEAASAVPLSTPIRPSVLRPDSHSLSRVKNRGGSMGRRWNAPAELDNPRT